MSSYLMDDSYRCTVFIGDNFIELFSEVLDWLKRKTPSGRLNDFYFVYMVYNYDGENGSSISVWHGELK